MTDFLQHSNLIKMSLNYSMKIHKYNGYSWNKKIVLQYYWPSINSKRQLDRTDASVSVEWPRSTYEGNLSRSAIGRCAREIHLGVSPTRPHISDLHTHAHFHYLVSRVSVVTITIEGTRSISALALATGKRVQPAFINVCAVCPYKDNTKYNTIFADADRTIPHMFYSAMPRRSAHIICKSKLLPGLCISE